MTADGNGPLADPTPGHPSRSSAINKFYLFMLNAVLDWPVANPAG